MPQGLAIGPSLFIYYINDLQERLQTTVRLFADDTIAYLTIANSDSARLLQENLDKLAKREKNWSLKFHPDKCNVLRVTNRRKPIKTTYKLHNQALEEVTSAKYLGVTIANNLSSDVHISSVVEKAMGFLRRNIRIHVSATNIKELAYFSLVRPLVEYRTNELPAMSYHVCRKPAAEHI